jgi:N utilization substance protein B
MAASGRHGARRLLVQALYQSQVGGHSAADMLRQFHDEGALERIDSDYFRLLLDEVLADTGALDALVVSGADRPVAQLDPVERGILWMGVTELQHHPDVPVRVVINEAVELAREFGAQDSYRYVNAVLDRLAPQLR